MTIQNKFFYHNRQALCQKLDLKSDEIVIIPGALLLQYHSDQAGEFLQESNFFYLSGINEPDCLLVIGHNYEYLMIPDNDEFEALWNGQLTQKQASEISGIENVYSKTEGWKKLKSDISNDIKIVYTLKQLPDFIYGNIFTNPARKILIDRLNKSFPKIQIKLVNEALAELRVIKQSPELKSIEQAVNLTMQVFKDVFEQLKDGMNEAEIDAMITHDFMRAGYREAYRSIIAGGNRSCIIHYVSNNHILNDGELLLIDAGVRVNGYAADITRTIPVGKSANTRQSEVMQAVKNVHDFAMKSIKPGITFIDYEKSVTAEMGRQLRELGLITDAKNEKQIREYFPHATSHFLGLDVHDVGARAEIEFQPNMVLTIEPGIYIPEESIGVRFEDNVVVTESGIKNLSENLPFSAKM